MIAHSQRHWWIWIALAAGLGLTVLLHGCHGPDEDHELFAPHLLLTR